MPKNWKRTILKPGDVKYVQGSRTTVEVIGEYESDKPLCKVLERSPTSIYEVGVAYNISRRILYPFKGRKKRSWD